MRAGDVFVVLADGFLEAEGQDGELFGSDSAMAVIASHHKLPPKSILDALRRAVLEHWRRASERRPDRGADQENPSMSRDCAPTTTSTLRSEPLSLKRNRIDITISIHWSGGHGTNSRTWS